MTNTLREWPLFTVVVFSRFQENSIRETGKRGREELVLRQKRIQINNSKLIFSTHQHRGRCVTTKDIVPALKQVLVRPDYPILTINNKASPGFSWLHQNKTENLYTNIRNLEIDPLGFSSIKPSRAIISQTREVYVPRTIVTKH